MRRLTGWVIAFCITLAVSAAGQPVLPGPQPGAVLAGGGGGPTWTIKASTKCGYTSSNSGCTTPPIDTTGANLIIASFGYFNASGGGGAVTVTDSLTNVWTQIGQSAGIGTGLTADMAMVISPTTGLLQTFTATTIGGLDSYAPLTILAVKDNSGTPSQDTSKSASCATGVTTIQAGSITPTVNNALVVSNILYNDSSSGSGVLSINGSFTIDQAVVMVPSQHFSGAVAHLAQSTAAAANPTWTATQSSTETCVDLVAFKP